ncbi:hypothetical protein B0H14DRAFT_3496582 [Mycena olivaceomarginata]|nr:hypothetical protein B0H14DRAFT_3496582 [Mycena olivaceomarginata]
MYLLLALIPAPHDLPRAPAVPPSRLSPPTVPALHRRHPAAVSPLFAAAPFCRCHPALRDAIPPHRAAVPPRATAVPPCTDAIPPPSRLSSLPRHLPPLLSLALMPSRRIPAALPPPATAVLPHSAAVPPCVE